MKKAIVIDGNSLLYRVYWATFKMLDYYKQNNLTPTNAVSLFSKAIIKLLEIPYDYCFIAFDKSRVSFRTEMLDEYKANRKPMPDELRVQLPILHDFIDSLGIKWEAKEGFEADDLIGSYCKLMNDNDIEVEVFSSDKDMLQLVNQLTHVNLFKVGVSETVKYTVDNFANLFYGLKPLQIIDFKAICGDGSDNFCGIKGIGPKTAANLLKKYDCFANIYQHIDELAPSQKQKFIDNKQSGELCYQIATIKKDLFSGRDLNDFIRKSLNKEQFLKLCNDWKLPTLINYLPKEN